MTSPGHIEHKNVSKPIPKESEILIQVKSIGVCGSDIHVNHGKHPFTSYPVIQGHEFCGIIDKVGEKIRTGFKIAIVGPPNSGKSSLMTVSYTHLTLPTKA